MHRTLEPLSALGLVERAEHPGSAARFGGSIDAHHHFLCARCGGLEDLPAAGVHGVDGLELVVEPPGTVDEVAVLVCGTCKACIARDESG